MKSFKNILYEKFKNIEFIFWAFSIFAVLSKCLYFQFTTNLTTFPFFSTMNLLMVFSTIGALLIVSSIAFVFNSKRHIVLFIINFILTIVLIADTNFFRYYYNLITLPVLFQFNPKLMSSINQSVISLFQPKDIVYILDLPLILAGIIMIQKKGIYPVRFAKRILRSMAMLTAGIVIIITIIPQSNINAFAYSNNYSAKSLGVLYSHFHNTKLFIKENILEKDDVATEEISMVKNYFDSKNKNYVTKNKNALAKGKNLIIVQIEALQHFVINRKIKGKEITPNLNKLVNDSLYFDNIYYQVAGGNTSDAEFLSNNSLYPAKEGSAYYRFFENKYNSLPKILKKQGYTTQVFHAFDKNFWNRETMYKAIGFDTFYSEEDFIKDELAGWDVGALSDSSFFRQSLDRIDNKKPFYSFFITLSSHHPFTYFQDYEFDTGEFEKTYIGNYLKAANYADKCIGLFIHDLKKRGLYDNSLLVMYGDHSAVPKIESEGLLKLLNMDLTNLNWLQLQKVPLIIHLPQSSEKGTISTTGGQIDIMPTVSNLMGLDTKYTLGKDLLNSSHGYAVLRNGSIITDDFIYFNDTREIYDIKTKQPVSLDHNYHEISSHIKELQISDLINQKNLFNYIP